MDAEPSTNYSQTTYFLVDQLLSFLVSMSWLDEKLDRVEIPGKTTVLKRKFFSMSGLYFLGRYKFPSL